MNKLSKNFDVSVEDMNTSMNVLFQPYPNFDFINPYLDLNIEPNSFIQWLQKEKQEISGNYSKDVAGMCEYSCLYLAMKFIMKKPLGAVKLICGKFGFWEHWWVEYTLDNETYIIDLTLQQFVPNAPKLAILKPTYSRQGYFKDENCEYEQTPMEYCTEKKAFQYYALP